MTPKEKAQELVNRYFLEIEGADTYAFNLPSMNLFIAKKCALIAVDEIIQTLNYDIRDLDVRGNVLLDLIHYWKEVKQEIEKL